MTPDEVAIALEATIAEPFTIPAALGQPPTAIPRYQAQVRPVLDRLRVKDYGKRKAALIDDGSGFPTFAELYVASRLRNAGWSCCWASVYQRLRFIDSWGWDAEKPILVSPPDDVFQVVAGIASIRQSATGRAKRSFGGLPDVIAWRGSDLLMLECKRRGEDRIRRTQEEWMHAAILSGLHIEQLGMFEWNY